MYCTTKAAHAEATPSRGKIQALFTLSQPGTRVLGSARPPALARAGPAAPHARGGPALVAAGRPQEGPDERCCREGDRLAVDQAWEGKGLGAAM